MIRCVDKLPASYKQIKRAVRSASKELTALERRKMNILDMNIKDLKPYEKNPRKNENAVEYVANSIKEFGFKVPIVVDKNNVIVAGHTRYKAAKKLGLKEVPVIIADDLTEEQVKAFRLADNKVGELATWDADLLGEELSDILDLDMEDFGFSFDDDDPEVIEDNPEIEPKKDPVTKIGDMWKMGGALPFMRRQHQH